MKWRRTISLGLAAAMTASTVLAGCGGDSGANGNASSGDNKNQTAATEISLHRIHPVMRQHFIRRDAAPESWVISFFWTMQIIWTA